MNNAVLVSLTESLRHRFHDANTFAKRKSLFIKIVGEIIATQKFGDHEITAIFGAVKIIDLQNIRVVWLRQRLWLRVGSGRRTGLR